MADKSERVKTADLKQGFDDQQEPASEAAKPKTEAGAVEDDVEEMSQEEISALISPVTNDQFSKIPEGKQLDENIDQLSIQDGGSDEKDIKINPPDKVDVEKIDPTHNKPEIDPSTPDPSDDHVNHANISDADPNKGSLNHNKEKNSQVPETDAIVNSATMDGTTSNGVKESVTDPINNSLGNDDDEGENSNKEILGESEAKDAHSTGHQHQANHLKVLGTILVGCLILVSLWGVILFRNQEPVYKSGADNRSNEEATIASPVPPVHEANLSSESQLSSDNQPDPLQENQTQLNRIRNDLLAKSQILRELQDQYRAGVARLKEELVAKIRKDEIESLNQAHHRNKTMFKLHTIQRRQAYIEQLEAPIGWLNEGSEDLLFLQRKHDIEAVVLPACRDITTERILAESGDAVRRFTNGSIETHLKVDLKSANFSSITQIWQDLLNTEKKANTVNAKTKPQRKEGTRLTSRENERESSNQSIYDEICAGMFDRKHDLTTLSEKAAGCLANWEEPDLFINQVTTLTPSAAQHLLKWKGKWLGLNGLTELSPEAASYLFNWEGEWVSLNGLIYMNSESSAYLSKWTGHTLEMMGLSSDLMARDSLALKHLSAWLKKGNQLFVPDDIRRLIMSQ